MSNDDEAHDSLHPPSLYVTFHIQLAALSPINLSPSYTIAEQ